MRGSVLRMYKIAVDGAELTALIPPRNAPGRINALAAPFHIRGDLLKRSPAELMNRLAASLVIIHDRAIRGGF
jgi:hypothetical protein